MTDEETKNRIHVALSRAQDAILACREAADGLDDIVRLVVRRKPDVYFFGVAVDQRNGHEWKASGHRSMPSRDGPVTRIDGVYAPMRDRHDPYAMGVARTVLVEKCTVVSWWDSSGDARGGSSSSFVARGVFTFDEMITAGREQHPGVLERFEKKYGYTVRSEP